MKPTTPSHSQVARSIVRRTEKQDRDAAVEAAILEHAIEAKTLQTLQKRLDRVPGISANVDGDRLQVSAREDAPAPPSILVVLLGLILIYFQAIGDVPLLLFLFVAVMLSSAFIALLLANCSWRPRVVSAVLTRDDAELWTLVSTTDPVSRSVQAVFSGFARHAELRPRVYDLLNQRVGSKATMSKGPSVWDRVRSWGRRGA